MGKLHVTSNLGRKVLEKEARDSFRALEMAEAGFEPGLRFGQAMIDLRKSGIKHGEWMPTLERLGITYRKAQYWMDAVRWANGERPKKPVGKKKGLFDWKAAEGWMQDWLQDLKSKVAILKKRRPKDAVIFAAALTSFASILRHDKKRRNHARVLQRTQPRGGSVAARSHARRTHPARGRR
jgi:hypothetical protein